MYSRLLAFGAASAMAASLAAQNGIDFAAWLQQRYPDFARANAADAVDAARRQGLLADPAAQPALKRTFQALRERKHGGGGGRPLLRDFPLGAPLPAGPVGLDNLVNEVEYNNGPEFATPLVVATPGRGDNSASNDIDVYSFVSTGEFVTAEIQPQGASPIIDSMLGVKNQNGQLMAFSEDISATNFLSRVSVYLPAGVYYAEVGPWDSTGGGGYDLAFQRDPVLLTPLAVGTNNGAAASPGSTQTVWTFTLAQDATIGIVVTASGIGSDLQLTVQLADGRIFFVNDDASGGGTDPAADLDLPAGSYTVHVNDLAGGATPYSLVYSVTPTVLADLGSGAVQNGSVTGPESRRLYRLTNAAAGDIDLQTAGGPTPVGDTILYLFDSDLDYLCDADDANAANPNDYYSRLQIGLPAGAYYVAARGWNTSAGDYTLAPFVGGPFPAVGAVQYGRTNVTVAGGGRVALATIDVCSGNSVRLDSVGGLAGTLYNFMTASGQSLGVMEWSHDSTRIGPGGRMRTRPTVGYLPRGTHWALTWHRFEQSSTNMFLDVLPPLHCEGTSLVGHGKAGDLAFLFGDFTPGAGVPFAGFGVDGWFCLPFGSPTVQTIGLGFYPASGAISWLTCPATPYGAYLQHGDLFAVPGSFLGAWRDRRRL